MGLDAIWESHPFTLTTVPTEAEASGDDSAKLVVKAAGDWTNKLFAVATKKRRGDVEGWEKSRGYPVAVLIEGPYGAFPSFILGYPGADPQFWFLRYPCIGIYVTHHILLNIVFPLMFRRLQPRLLGLWVCTSGSWWFWRIVYTRCCERHYCRLQGWESCHTQSEPCLGSS